MLFNVRTDSDYDDFYVVSKEETIEQFEDAKHFLREIEDYLKTK